MKIIFIGAGMAALVASERLARNGYEVSVFEKQSYNDISYDWHDDVNRAAFDENDLPMPREGTYFTKRNWTFVPPSERVEVTLGLPKKELDLSIERRLLAQQYIDRAKDVVDFHFGTEVDGLIVEDNKVCGITVDGHDVYADLVVDNSGVLSKFRASLPKAFGITRMPEQDEIFVAYRAFYKKADGEKDPVNTNRAYLKHLGRMGISWSILDPAGTVNVLIGHAAKLTDEDLSSALAALKISNPIIGDSVVRGGIKCIIPIRRPLTRMVADGYIAIGDCAFMTIPMIGSGIENSIKAASILADTIISSNSCSKQTLWQYQCKYYEAKGAEHIGVDILKRWLLSCPPNKLDWLFEKGIVSAKDMGAGATGKLLKLSVKDMLSKAMKGISKLPLLLSMSAMLSKCKKAAKLGLAIPKNYNEKEISKWEEKLNRLFR